MSSALRGKTSDPSAPLVDAHGVGLTLGGRHILHGVDLTVERGRIVTLIGPNGAGKTCLVRVLLGLMSPTEGSVGRAAGLRVGYMPQRVLVDEVLPITVGRFLTLGGRASRPHQREVLGEVGVEHLLEQPIQSVSGGEMQRVLLARALLRRPDLLVLDEPAQGVDVSGQGEIFRLIAGLRDRYGCGVLLVSHELHLVMEAADSVVCLNQHVCCTGLPEAVSRHPEYLKLFGDPAQARGFAIYTHDHDHHHDLHGGVIEHQSQDKGARTQEGTR
jgi:zinc transport system ATP-binding protein